MTQGQESFEVDQWGIVELMGHKVVAGKISKSEMLGKPMLRVDIPAVGNIPAFTQMYGEAAIYCVTFVSEDIARQTATATRAAPIIPYTSSAHQLTSNDEEPDPDDGF
jgi:hypothetical protein